jgi:hypothetical protein
MFEAGGQPISGAPGSFAPIEKGAPDLATNGLFQYGVYKGVPRGYGDVGVTGTGVTGT